MSQNWTSFDIPEESQASQQQSDQDDALWMESVMRVTCAGFCGALVGMSRQNQSSASKIFQRAVVSGGKKRPPRALPKLKTVQQSSQETNLPLQWAFSFMAFVSILETSRFWSPTTLLMNLYQQPSLIEQENSGNEEQLQPLQLNPPEYTQQFPGGPKSLATIVDCTLGGTVAGLAGGMAKQRPPPTSSSTSPLQLPSSILKSGRRSLVVTGIGTGMALGLFAGTFQAGLDVMEHYAMLEKSRQEELEAERIQEMRRLEEAEAQREKEQGVKEEDGEKDSK